MGFFDEIKKVLFGVKAVSKSAADKAMDKGLETGKVIADKTGEALESVKDKAEDIFDDVKDVAGDVWDKAVDVAEDVGGKVLDKAEDIYGDVKDVAEDVGEKVLDVADKAVDKAKDVGGKLYDKAEDLAADLKSQAGDTFGKGNDDEAVSAQEVKFTDTEPEISDVSELFGDDTIDKADMTPPLSEVSGTVEEKGSELEKKVTEIKNDVVEKAKSLTDDLSEKIDETVEKAKDLAAKEAAEPEYKPPSEHLHKDLLEDKDDFFKKAAAFADGDYDEVRDPFSNKPKIIKVEEDTSSTESNELLAGFEDLDGDGNEIVDDAIIVKDDEEE